MHRSRTFDEGFSLPLSQPSAPAAAPAAFVVCPSMLMPGVAAYGPMAWGIYGLAYRQAQEALRPSLYTRLTAATLN